MSFDFVFLLLLRIFNFQTVKRHVYQSKKSPTAVTFSMLHKAGQ